MNNPFELLSEQLSRIENKLGEIDILFHRNKETPNTLVDQWFDLNELVAYDPEKRTKATFYGYIHNMEIPFHKRGKKLIFLKAEIDTWLKSGRKKTVTEIANDAEMYLSNKIKNIR